MSKIQEAFQNKKAFIGFITGGDPDLETTEKLIVAMAEAGADLIEIGLPFSDPTAESAVIQAANIRALSGGCTTDKLFDTVRSVRRKVKVPMVFLTYMNPVYTYGKERFMGRCVECGIDGLLIPDLPFEEKGELMDVCEAHGVEILSFIAGGSKERIRRIAGEARGFLYVSVPAGVKKSDSQKMSDVRNTVKFIRESTDLPCAIGGGIETPEQARKMAEISDGAIVESAVVKLVAEYGRDSVSRVADYVKMMKSAAAEISAD